MADSKQRLSCEEIEELVPDLLYGELDGDREREVRERITECELEGKIAGYEKLRAAFRSLPDEEPPPAITAQLLHAAAKQVGGKATGVATGVVAVGFWARMRKWFEPLAMHPGLAATASLLVVGGVVGVLYLSGKDKVAQPNAPTHATAPSSTVESTAELRFGSDAPAPAPGNGASAEEKPAAEPELAERPDVANNRDNVSDNKHETPRKRAVSKKLDSDKRRFEAGGSTSGLLGGDTGTVGGAPSPDDAAGEDGLADGDTVGPAVRAPDPAPEPAPASPPPPPKASKKKPKEQAKAPAGGGKVEQQQEADPAPSVRALHSQARSAAERGDCAKARSIASRIQSIDADYWRASVRDDKQLAKCLNAAK
jgi:hypothetical protein